MLGSLFEEKEKKVEYLELIYDLIFVYLIGRNSSLVHHVENGFIQWDLFLTYALCTLITIQIWNYTAFYINRYGSNGIRDHICIFINMYLLYYMADATRVDWADYYYRYNIAWGLIILNLALQYYLHYRKAKKETPWETAHIRWYMWTLLVQVILIAVGILVFSLTGFPFTPVAMLFGIVIHVFAGRVNDLVSVDFSHLSERAMLFVVFTFGEMIIAIASYFSGRFGLNTIYFSLFAFLIIVGLFLSYELFYDHLIDREYQTNGSIYMLIHVFMIFALSGVTIALEFMQEETVAARPKILFISCALILYYICLFLLARYCKGSTKPKLSFILKMCLLGAVFIGLMNLFYQNMYINIALTVLFVFAVFVILWKYKKQHGCS